ncbi:MAG: SDR family oxidoreductase [Bauldia sp.]|nr:SDR family oxidoreductase [Bauldia sp.]
MTVAARPPCRVLVTGGAGFLGSHLCDRLLADGHAVTALDNYLTGRPENLAHLAGAERFTFVEADVRQPLSGRFDLIFHLACPASPTFYQADPVATATIAFLGTLNALQLARDCGARLVFASTSEVYGDPEEHPQSESYPGRVNPTGPRACYDEGKRIGETLCFDFRRVHGVDVKVARIFNTYGPRMSDGDGRVVSNFIVQALSGGPITVYGNGLQTRSFCYVDDLVAGLVAASLQPAEFAGPVNLGNPAEFSIRQLAEMVIALTGSPSRLVSAPLPVDDPRQRRPEIALARSALGWAPSVSLRDGLERTIRYFAGSEAVALPARDAS